MSGLNLHSQGQLWEDVSLIVSGDAHMTIIGIDIAKRSFHATMFAESKVGHRTFQNTPKGFQAFQRWFEKKSASPGHACMEATGIYWEPVALFLHTAGWTVSVVNPLRIKAFGQSELARNKTDQYDSRLIARFCQEKCPDAWTPPSPEHRTLQALARHLEALEKTRQQQRNRLEACADPIVDASLHALIEQLDTHIAQLAQQIQQHITSHPALSHQQDLLCSITGIGTKTAQVLLAELPKMATYPNARKVAAQAGLTPKHFQSGTSIHGRTKLSKIGNARLRKALYFPAISAMRHNAILTTFASRLRKKGKSEMSIIGAVMRKLLHLAYGVLKHNKKFDPNYLN
jgi:transposase